MLLFPSSQCADILLAILNRVLIASYIPLLCSVISKLSFRTADNNLSIALLTLSLLQDPAWVFPWPSTSSTSSFTVGTVSSAPCLIQML